MGKLLPFPQSPDQERLIYSLGTSHRTILQFLTLFKEFQLDVGVDVRSFPTSRFPHFSREALEDFLRSKGYSYIYLGRELGGFRKGGYLEYMKSECFQTGLEKLEEIGKYRRTAFFCSERFPWKCHRRWIAEALVRKGWKVVHIIEPNRVWIPKTREGS